MKNSSSHFHGRFQAMRRELGFQPNNPTVIDYHAPKSTLPPATNNMDLPTTTPRVDYFVELDAKEDRRVMS